MISNTGCTSVGDSLMTRSTSDVAVCRASASWVSLNRRTFSIAITAWSANERMSAIWRASKISASGRAVPIAPMTRPSRTIGVKSTELKPNSRAKRWVAGGVAGSSSAANCVVSCVSMTRPPMFEPSRGRGKLAASRSKPSLPPSAGISIISSRRSCTAANCVPKSFRRLATMASNTGWTSVGELAMTFRISAVAVWRCSASAVSSTSRTFSSAIPMLAAMVSRSRTSASP